MLYQREKVNVLVDCRCEQMQAPRIDALSSELSKFKEIWRWRDMPDEKSEVMLGPMLLARNPSLHPGDVRVVYGVDVPQLHHLKDVVVLPQTGDRDVAGMCSGGDLDGDDFLVIWDQDLLPNEWNHEPMDYSRPAMEQPIVDIGIDDLTTFFVTYLKDVVVGVPDVAEAEDAAGTPNSTANAALADKKRERGNASAAAKIIQRVLGLGGHVGGRGERRSALGNAVNRPTPGNAASAAKLRNTLH